MCLTMPFRQLVDAAGPTPHRWLTRAQTVGIPKARKRLAGKTYRQRRGKSTKNDAQSDRSSRGIVQWGMRRDGCLCGAAVDGWVVLRAGCWGPESLGDATARLAKMMPSQVCSKGSSETDGRARTAPVVGSRNCNEGARVGDGYVKNGES